MCTVCLDVGYRTVAMMERTHKRIERDQVQGPGPKTPEEWREEIAGKADWKRRRAGVFLMWTDSYSEEQFGPGIYTTFHQALEAIESQLGLRWCPRSSRIEYMRWQGEEWSIDGLWNINDIAHLLGVTLDWAVSEDGTEMTARSPELHRRATCPHDDTRRGLYEVDERGATQIRSRLGRWATISTCMNCGLITGRAA